VENEERSVIDVGEWKGIVWMVVRELDFDVTKDSMPKGDLKTSSKHATLFFFRNAMLRYEESRNLKEIAIVST
jgi:hypothetical protein